MAGDRFQGRAHPSEAAAAQAPGGASGTGAGAASRLGPTLDAIFEAPPESAALLRAAMAAAPDLSGGAVVVRVEDGWRVDARVGTDGPPPPPEAAPLAGLEARLRDARPACVPPSEVATGLLAPSARAACFAPITGAGGVLGVALLGSRTGRVADEDLVVVRAVAERVGRRIDAEVLHDQVVRAQDAARHTGGFRDQILAIVGHDLRNPLGAIVMSAALLRKRGGLEGWQARTVDRVHGSAARMGRIIDDLLSYTRTRLGGGIPIARAPADLLEIATRMVEELRVAHPDAVVELDAEGDLAGTWDCARLEQVLSNLVSNAIDHGDGRHPIRLRLRGEGDAVSLDVENRGEMPRDALEHAFEAFRRPPDGVGRKASGLGLGLFIAREIVRRHGGEITVRCEHGWTRIAMTLPRGEQPDAPSPAPA